MYFRKEEKKKKSDRKKPKVKKPDVQAENLPDLSDIGKMQVWPDLDDDMIVMEGSFSRNPDTEGNTKSTEGIPQAPGNEQTETKEHQEL